MNLIPIDEVVYVDVITSTPSTSAAVDADSPPTFDVFEEATDTPILDDQAMTKRTSLTGNYRGSFTASAANGFEAGKWYSVIATAGVGGVTGKCVVKNFRVAPAETSAGVPQVRVSAIADGLLAAATFASGAFDAVWSVATRALTAFAFTPSLHADYDAAKTAASQASVDAVAAKTTNLPSDPADQSLIIAATDALLVAINALNNVSDSDIANAIGTREPIAGFTYDRLLRIAAATSGGHFAGPAAGEAGTGTLKEVGTGSTPALVTATLDEDGNRTVTAIGT